MEGADESENLGDEGERCSAEDKEEVERTENRDG